MSRPEPLTRRVRRTEEDLTAIADTVFEIKEVVEGHTEVLADHGRELVEIRGVVEGHTEVLADHGRELVDIKQQLVDLHTQVSDGFAAIIARLDA